MSGKLRASGIDADRLLASQAERGMRLIDREGLRLRAPGSAAIDQTRSLIQEIYARAYKWSAPSLPPEERLTTTLMRQYVRRGINEWDLKRLYPDHEVHMVAEELKMDYSEDRDLEVSAGDEAEPHVVSLSFAEPSFRTLRRAGTQIGDRGETTGYRSVTAGSRTGISRR